MRQIIAPRPAVATSACEPARPFLDDSHVTRAEKSLACFRALRLVALRATDEPDWTDFGGTPYLNSAGALKIATALGVSLKLVSIEATREKLGDHEVARYVAQVSASFLGREIALEGVASSDEAFFARKNGRSLPLAEINLGSVRKKALTQAHARAVKAVLGLEGVSWQDLRAAGVTRNGTNRVEYTRPRVSPNILAALAQ